MEYNERLEEFQRNKNSYDESDQRIAQFMREEKQKQNIYHGNMIKLYKDKRYREKIIKKAEKRNYDTGEIIKAKEISKREPFDIKNVSIFDLECLYSVEVFVENVSASNNNALIRFASRIEEMLFGSDENEERGDR